MTGVLCLTLVLIILGLGWWFLHRLPKISGREDMVRRQLLRLKLRKVGDGHYKLVLGSPYPSDWKHRRSLVLRRDHFTCQNCRASGLGVSLEVHHVVPIADGGSHDLNNLVALCGTCHKGRR